MEKTNETYVVIMELYGDGGNMNSYYLKSHSPKSCKWGGPDNKKVFKSEAFAVKVAQRAFDFRMDIDSITKTVVRVECTSYPFKNIVSYTN